MKFNLTSTIEVEAENKEEADKMLWNEQKGLDTTKELAFDLLRNAEIDEIEE